MGLLILALSFEQITSPFNMVEFATALLLPVSFLSIKETLLFKVGGLSSLGNS